MSITVNILYKGKNESSKKFVEEMISRGIVDLIRKEPGNISYEYYQSLSNPEDFLLVDRWENQESLDIHHASSMMKTIMELKEKYDLHMEVMKYENIQEKDNDNSFIRK